MTIQDDLDLIRLYASCNEGRQDEMQDDFDAALNRIAAALPKEGWVCVPQKLTQPMLDDSCVNDLYDQFKPLSTRDKHELWRAWLKIAAANKGE